MTRDTPPEKPVPRSHTLRRAAARLRRGSSARRQDEARARRTVSSAVEELLGRYHARPLSYAQMKKSDVVTARIPIAADPMLGSALVRELTTPFSLSIGAFPWDAELFGRGKKVGNWLHRHYVLGKRDGPIGAELTPLSREQHDCGVKLHQTSLIPATSPMREPSALTGLAGCLHAPR
ncbi:hypothetical protein [Streptomyces sp. FZ201]|uniref:hypothetical protein n=1 Tax=Streptomyces sp. FZ201 TaxID=3057122 RepID=UPI0021C08A5B|nr:hypothetical protein [Streptomyces sp. FZ201]